LAEYTGNIQITASQKSPHSLTFYSADNINIEMSAWKYNAAKQVYVYTLTGYKDAVVTAIRDTNTKQTLLVDVDYKDDNTILFTAIHNDAITATILHSSIIDNLSDSDTFYPTTKGSVVKFSDGETLETKYINGDLSKFSPANPNLSSLRYIKKIKEDTFIENKGKYSIVIYGKEHKLGLNVVVGTILKEDLDTKIFTQIMDGTITIDNNKTQSEGATIILTFDTKFIGYIVLHKEKALAV
jgi:hypothetical protein